MGYRVFQGTSTTPIVLSQDTYGGATVDVAEVYVNENGREVRVEYVSDGAQPVAVPRSGAAGVTQPPPSWSVVASTSNVPPWALGAFAATVPAPVPGATIQLTTSTAGRDEWTFERTPDAQGRKLVVRVTRGLTLHYVEMMRPHAVGTQTTFSLKDVGGENLLERAIDYFYDKFGIDFSTPDTTQVPHHVLNTGSLQTSFPQATGVAPSSRGSRDLWVVATGEAKQGTHPVAGFAGGSLVVINIPETARTLTSYQSILAESRRFRTAHDYVAALLRADPNMSADDLDFHDAIASGMETPEHAAAQQALATLIHEIGHALGCVPTSDIAAGSAQSNWNDGSHTNHCSVRSCVMFAGAEDAIATRFSLVPGGADPPFHGQHRQMGLTPTAPDHCYLYMLTCDLADIRSLPR